MRAVDLKPFEILTIPENQSELLRALVVLMESTGAERFGYVQLPKPFSLLERGVRPRMLSNYPDHIMRDYLRVAKKPFSMIMKAITTRQPVFFTDALTPEEVLFQRLGQQSGFQDGVIIPIRDTEDAVFCFAFRQPINRRWVDERYSRSMATLSMLVHMGIQGRQSLCPEFQVPGFTPRIKQILSLKARGLTNEQVAQILGVKPDTIKKAIRRFSERLGGLSTVELVHHMTKLGMI